ncbi:MAG: TIGR03000 domain-containing protein [Pirellulales bacterium]
MFRPNLKKLVLGAIVAAALSTVNAPQANAFWHRGCWSGCYSGAGCWSPCSYWWYAPVYCSPCRPACSTCCGCATCSNGCTDDCGCCDTCGGWTDGCVSCQGAPAAAPPAVPTPAPKKPEEPATPPLPTPPAATPVEPAPPAATPVEPAPPAATTPAEPAAPSTTPAEPTTPAPTMPDAAPSLDTTPAPAPEAGTTPSAKPESPLTPPTDLIPAAPLTPVPKAKTPGKTSSNAVRTSGLLSVQVPEDAKIFINGLPTASTGIQRRYLSRNMEPGSRYTFEVRAEMVRDGKTLTETKVARLEAGQRAKMAFEFSAPAEQAAASPAQTTLILHVPADAVVFLAGKPTRATGAVRQFSSTKVTEWSRYPVRVVLQRDGRTLAKEETVSLRAGETRELTFDFASPQLAGVR